MRLPGLTIKQSWFGQFQDGAVVILWMVLGAVLGAWAGLGYSDQGYFGGLVGAALGLLWARQSRLSKQLAATRARLDALAQPATTSSAEADAIVRRAADLAQPEISQPTHVARPADEPQTPSPSQPIPSQPIPSQPRLPEQVPDDAWIGADAVSPPTSPASTSPPMPSGPSPIDLVWQRTWGWFTEGNVPVKVGMLILFAGVAALLKYASDSGMLHLPIGLRLSVVGLASIGGLAFGWRQRTQRRTFALSLQGGAIGVLIIVIFAAFRLYHLVPAGAAFGFLLVLVAGIGMLAVLQDSLALAMLGLFAGFAAPILISTGQGNHVALFTYYAVLNLAILGIALKRSWRVLNLLGFIATFGIGTTWGVLQYQPNLFSSTEPFLVLNFLFYLIIPWLHVWRAPVDRRLIIDGGLMFGNPLISLLLQGALLKWNPHAMAISSLVGAAVYVTFGFAVRKHPAMRLLRDTWAVLAIMLATLTVPLAFNANVTGGIFALEGAGLLWLGLHQRRLLASQSGLVLQLLAAGALIAGRHSFALADWPILNRDFIGALLLIVAGIVSCTLYVRIEGERPTHRLLAVGLYAWVLLWWLGASGAEITRFADMPHWPAAWFAFLAFTAWLTAELAARVARFELGAALRYSAPAFLFATLLVLLRLVDLREQPLAGWMLAAIAMAAVLGWRSLMCLRAFPLSAVLAQLAWLWRWCVIFMLAAWAALDGARWLSSSWVFVLSFMPALLLTAVTLWRARWIASPLTNYLPQWRVPLLYSLFALLGLLALAALGGQGDATPLPYIPLVNPLELMLLATIFLFARWVADDSTPLVLKQQRAMLAGVIVLIFVTDATLRAVHQLGGVGWDDTLADSSLAQMSLTVVWSVLGLVAWVWGSRRGHRMLWLAGAIMMGIVLAKLLLIDRAHLGNLFGIGSFIVYGILCTVIGYLAPAPPKQGLPLSSAGKEGGHAP